MILIIEETNRKEDCQWLTQGKFCSISVSEDLKEKKKKGLNKYVPIQIFFDLHECNHFSFALCPGFRPCIKRTGDFCVFNTFYDWAFDYIIKNNLSTDFLINLNRSQGYCSILDKFMCFPLKEPCPHHAYKLIEIPNPFFHNNRICPYCNKYVKKGSRIQVGKRYQWFHVDCRRNHGFKYPMGFLDFKPKLRL